MKATPMPLVIVATLLVAATATAQIVQTPLPGSAIPQFVDPLPIPEIVDGTSPVELHMREFQANVMPSTFIPAAGAYTGTWVWGYIVGPDAPVGPQSTYLGPVIVAERDIPTTVTYVNDLGHTSTSNVLAWVNSTDQTLHWADPLNGQENMCAHMVMPGQLPGMGCDEHYSGPIPSVPHLHGGEVPPVLDGGPDAWFTSDGVYHGNNYYTKDRTNDASNSCVYVYPNKQEAAPIWFHDHTLGVTRLNVYAGLAGGYLLTDVAKDPANLPPLIPLIVQDRMFDTNGQLYFPAGLPFISNPEHPYWVPEFVGDTIVVNGKVWPYVNVEPKRYRFIFFNGSNARTYEMFLDNPKTKVMGPAIWQIGTDGGYLDKPVKIDPNAPTGQLQRLVLMPGERADVIVDFKGLTPGTTLVLRNIAKTPYPGGAAASGSTVGRIVQIRVGQLTAPDTSYDPASGGALRSPMKRLVAYPLTGQLAAGVTAQKTRQLTLNEIMGMPTTVNGVAYPGGPLEILVNNTKWDGRSFRPYGDFTAITVGGITTYYSELPTEGENEIWEIVNLTADAHPIHLHLVQFQVLNRQRFDVPKYLAKYNASFPGGGTDPMTGLPYPPNVFIPGFGPPLDYNTGIARALGGNPDVVPFLKGVATPPDPNEAGWKDTVRMLPGQVTRIAVRWAPTDLPNTTAPADAFFPFDPSGAEGYVWHCHIIDHEDNEMMRPDSVIANPDATRTYVQEVDY